MGEPEQRMRISPTRRPSPFLRLMLEQLIATENRTLQGSRRIVLQKRADGIGDPFNGLGIDPLRWLDAKNSHCESADE